MNVKIKGLLFFNNSEMMTNRNIVQARHGYILSLLDIVVGFRW